MTGRPGGADLRQRHRRPAAFCEVSSVGTYVGLMPRRFQSGKDNHTGHVSKHGDALLRTHLFEAARIIVRRVAKWSTLKAWGTRLAKRVGRRPPSPWPASSPASCIACRGTAASSAGQPRTRRPHEHQIAAYGTRRQRRVGTGRWPTHGHHCGSGPHGSEQPRR